VTGIPDWAAKWEQERFLFLLMQSNQVQEEKLLEKA